MASYRTWTYCTIDRLDADWRASCFRLVREASRGPYLSRSRRTSSTCCRSNPTEPWSALCSHSLGHHGRVHTVPNSVLESATAHGLGLLTSMPGQQQHAYPYASHNLRASVPKLAHDWLFATRPVRSCGEPSSLYVSQPHTLCIPRHSRVSLQCCGENLSAASWPYRKSTRAHPSCLRSLVTVCAPGHHPYGTSFGGEHHTAQQIVRGDHNW